MTEETLGLDDQGRWCGEFFGAGFIMRPCEVTKGHEGPHASRDNDASLTKRREWIKQNTYVPVEKTESVVTVDGAGDLRENIAWMNRYLNSNTAPVYKQQPLAQDWARVMKIAEEHGEAVDALIGMTGQNPRKGVYAAEGDLLDELADVALTAMHAIQHFLGEEGDPLSVVTARSRFSRSRVER